MKQFEITVKFKGEPLLTLIKKARTESGAKFSAILEASMNGFDVNVVESIKISELGV